MKIPFTVKKLESSDGKVQIEFWRGWTKHPRLGKFRRTTHCDIRVDGTQVNAPAWLHPRDSFHFRAGARESFTKAVASLPKALRLEPWRLYLRHIEKFEIQDKAE